jgi:hypothetical protein
MNEINWNEMIGFLNDVDNMVEEFTKLFLDIARQSIPTKTITVWDYDKPWFNNEIRKEIRLRDRLRKNVLFKKPIISFQLISFILLLKSSKSIFSYCQISLVNEHEVDFGHLRKATAAS